MPQFEAGSFFGALFDFSFRRYVTPSIVAMVFVIGLAVGGLIALITLVGGLAQGQWMAVIIVPLGFLLFVVYLRVVLEVFVAVIRIAQNTARMAPAPARAAPEDESLETPEGHA